MKHHSGIILALLGSTLFAQPTPTTARLSHALDRPLVFRAAESPVRATPALSPSEALTATLTNDGPTLLGNATHLTATLTPIAILRQWRWISTTVDNSANVGVYTSVAIGTDGLPVISYRDQTNNTLKVAQCQTLSCTSAISTTVDNSANAGTYNSLAIGMDGLPVISYYDDTNDALKIAKCQTVSCTSVVSTTVDSSANVGFNTSVAIGTDGLPVISYFDVFNGALKVANCQTMSCTSVVSTTVDSSAEIVGEYTSLAIGMDGLPVISYYDDTNDALKVAKCQTVSCTSVVSTTVDSSANVGLEASMTIGPDGLPVISYYDVTNDILKVAKCRTMSCASAIITIVDSMGDVGKFTSLAIGPDGLPVISYYDSNNRVLKVAQCQTVSCTSAISTTVDSVGDVGLYTSVAIGTDGLPVISYFDATNTALKVAKALTATVTYTLDYGDGTAPVTGAWDAGILPFTHTYALPGSYTAILTATDGLSSTSVSSVVSIVANNGLLGNLTSVFQGRFVTYTLVVTNTNANLQASNVILSGSVPGNARLVSAATALTFMTGGDYGTGYVQSPTPMTLLPGQSVQLTWVVEVMALTGDVVTQGHAVSDSAVIQVNATARIYRIFMPVIRKDAILIE